MRATTARQKAIRDAVRRLLPAIPMFHAEAVFDAAISRRFRHMAPHDAVILSATARARHEETSYDALLAEGMDRDAARFLTREDTQDALDVWGATFSVGDGD